MDKGINRADLLTAALGLAFSISAVFVGGIISTKEEIREIKTDVNWLKQEVLKKNQLTQYFNK